MIFKNKFLHFFFFLLCLIFLFLFTFTKDPFVYNYSMFSSSIKGHVYLLILCFLLGMNLAYTTYLLDKKRVAISFVAPLIGAIFPYRAYSGDLFSNIHEICAYISFFLVMYITLTNIEKYKLYDYKRAVLIKRIFIIIFFLDGLIYLRFLAVKAIEEFILLFAVVLLHKYIWLFSYSCG